MFRVAAAHSIQERNEIHDSRNDRLSPALGGKGGSGYFRDGGNAFDAALAAAFAQGIVDPR